MEGGEGEGGGTEMVGEGGRAFEEEGGGGVDDVDGEVVVMLDDGDVVEVER